MRILFQGDSITDAGRDRANMFNLGPGYPSFAAAEITRRLPGADTEFVNLGISGDRTECLVARLQSDFIDVAPDIVSILIGINDTWHHAGDKSWIPDEVYESNYRTVLEALKNKTNAKIVILEQFLLYAPDKEFFREDLYKKIQITRKLAYEYADVFVPLDGILAARALGHQPLYLSDDGVHPNAQGSAVIGEIYADAVVPLLG